MPALTETTVYTFDELSAAAKETALAWYRAGGFDCDWYDAVYEDFPSLAQKGQGYGNRVVPVKRFCAYGMCRRSAVLFFEQVICFPVRRPSFEIDPGACFGPWSARWPPT